MRRETRKHRSSASYHLVGLIAILVGACSAGTSVSSAPAPTAIRDASAVLDGAWVLDTQDGAFAAGSAFWATAVSADDVRQIEALLSTFHLAYEFEYGGAARYRNDAVGYHGDQRFSAWRIDPLSPPRYRLHLVWSDGTEWAPVDIEIVDEQTFLRFGGDGMPSPLVFRRVRTASPR